MAKHLNSKVDEIGADNLIAGLNPPVLVASGVIAKPASAERYARGTVLAKSTQTGKLCILGSTANAGDTLVADSILCDNEDIDDVADTNVAIYVAGYFNIDALVAKDGYTITEADKDKLRERSIFLGQMFE